MVNKKLYFIVLIVLALALLLLLAYSRQVLGFFRQLVAQREKISFSLNKSNDSNKLLNTVRNSSYKYPQDHELNCFLDLSRKCFVVPEAFVSENGDSKIKFNALSLDANVERSITGMTSLLYGDPLLLTQLEGINVNDKSDKEVGLDVLTRQSFQYKINPVYIASILRYMPNISYSYFSQVSDFVARKTRQYFNFLMYGWANEWWYGKFDLTEKRVLQELSQNNLISNAQKIVSGFGILYFNNDFAISLSKPLFPLFQAQILKKEYSLEFSSFIISDTNFSDLNSIVAEKNVLSLGVCRGESYYWCVDNTIQGEDNRLLCKKVLAFPQACKRKQKMLEIVQ